YLSDALYQRPEQLQLAAFAGAWAISLLIVSVNYLLYRALRERRIRWLALAVVLVVLNTVWGNFQLSMQTENDKRLHLALVHSSVPQRARSDPDQLESLHALYIEQLQSLEGAKRDLIILPESILPTYLLLHSDLLRDYQETAQRLALSLIVGTIDYRDGRLFNSAALIAPDGQIAGIYDKVQLVPFSTEYFPLIDFLRSTAFSQWLSNLPLGVLTAGERWEPLRSSVGAIGTPICFESIFSNISRAFVREGAQVLAIITNDAWFKGSTALEQHFAKAVFRAIETGRYTVQAANGGLSGVIDPRGRIRAQTRSPNETVLQAEVFLQDRQTLYVSLGDWVISLCALGLIALVFVARVRARSPALR
ncbi:MAG: apolipoprotein N-acyltransferase, partial [Candidatus Bipolaricaulota bacterium]|nr:apolipoprotein N-acyltransferase [Candidatus Bipolaricaulota bacterium]MDW8141273.1 apolipoprotein N-acyltransferase [Candidatus Bipolaricaulota bacterium]